MSSNEFSDEKQAEMLEKVRKLLQRAEHEATPPGEADVCRQRAEALMFKYRLDEGAAALRGDITVTPIWREVTLTAGDSEFATFYYQLAGIALHHVGARGTTSWFVDEDGQTKVKLTAVGYSADINYMDMLLTACLVEFAKRLEPKADPNLSFEDNVYAMRQAGMERKRIARVLLGEWQTENEMKAKNRKVTAAFKRACEKRGEDWSVLLGRGNNVKTYRKSYAEGFVSTINARLFRLRTANVEEGGGLVLMSRKEKVDEAYYARYPQYDPKNQKKVNDPREDCEKCKRAKSGYCRDHSYMRPSMSFREAPTNHTARNRGSQAAALVDLGPNAAGRGRMTEPTRGAIG